MRKLAKRNVILHNSIEAYGCAVSSCDCSDVWCSGDGWHPGDHYTSSVNYVGAQRSAGVQYFLATHQ